jgi:ATP-binding cassette subfamily F protein uup
MSLLALKDVGKSYDSGPVLREVGFALQDGERVGLVGRNGSGKTTLLRILAGVEAPDSGERIARRDLKLGWLEQEPKLDLESSVRDAVRLGLQGREQVLAELERIHRRLAGGDAAADAARLAAILAQQARLESELDTLGGHDVEHRVEEMVHALGLRDADATCATLSGGERRRVALARLLIGAPDLLLLDEPTNHLDALVTDWLEDRLLESKVPLLLVTHDRYFLDRIVDRIVELEHGRLTEYDGGYSQYLLKKAAADHAAGNAAHERRMLLRRETAWARKGPPARLKKSRSRMARYEALVADVGDAPLGTVSFQLPPGPRLGTKVLVLHGITRSYGGRVVVPPIDFELRPGMRLGIVGPNGAGKSTFLALCTGELAPDGAAEGPRPPAPAARAVGETVQFAAIDQQRRGLDPTNSVVDEVARADQEHVKVGAQSQRVESFLDRFLFPGPRKWTKVADLSGGERNRVLLAKLLIQGGNVVVLDEPTNDLDLETLRILEEALCAFPGCALIVSHDRWFLDRVATHILHLDGAGHARFHEGDLSTLLARIAGERAAAAAAPSAASPASAPPAAQRASPSKPARRKLSFREQKEYDAIPDRLAALEAEAAALDARFADPELYRSPNDLASLKSRRSELTQQISALYERWEQLEEDPSAR